MDGPKLGSKLRSKQGYTPGASPKTLLLYIGPRGRVIEGEKLVKITKRLAKIDFLGQKLGSKS